MSNVKKLGRSIKDTSVAAEHNVRRYAEKFPYVDRGVGYFNKLHPHTTSFKMPPGKSAYLNVKLVDAPIPCTINSPDTRVECVGVLTGANPGAITRFASNSGGFTLSGGQIVVPVAGCYSVYFVSWASGYTQMRGDAIVGAALTHNGQIAIGLTRPAQGVWGFGGGVWTYAPPSPFYKYMACNVGDTIGGILTQSVTGSTVDWWGPRDFSLWMNDDGSTTISIKLIAEAET